MRVVRSPVDPTSNTFGDLWSPTFILSKGRDVLVGPRTLLKGMAMVMGTNGYLCMAAARTLSAGGSGTSRECAMRRRPCFSSAILFRRMRSGVCDYLTRSKSLLSSSRSGGLAWRSSMTLS